MSHTSLCSFLLNTVERVLDVHISASMDPALLFDSQHASASGKPAETTLHSLISRLEKSMHVKEYTLEILCTLKVHLITSTRTA